VQSDASQNTISVSTSHPYFWAPFILVGDGK
jgi:CHAT domain-containing protein